MLAHSLIIYFSLIVYMYLCVLIFYLWAPLQMKFALQREQQQLRTNATWGCGSTSLNLGVMGPHVLT